MMYLVTWSIGVTLADVRSSGVRMGSPKTKTKNSHKRLHKSIKKEERKDERDERGIERPTEGWMGMQSGMGGVRD